MQADGGLSFRYGRPLGRQISVEKGNDRNMKKRILSLFLALSCVVCWFSSFGLVTAADPNAEITNVALNKKTATFSSYDSAANAVDGNMDTTWHAQWGWGCIYVDFGEEMEISKLNLKFPDGYFNEGGDVDFRFEAVSSMPEPDENGNFSDSNWLNDKSHITSVIVPQNKITADAEITFDSAVRTRYVRYYVEGTTTSYTDNGNKVNYNAKLAELEVYGAVAPEEPAGEIVNAALNKKIAVFNGSWESPAFAFDGSLETQWHAMQGWACVYVDLGEMYEISQLKVAFPKDYFADGDMTYRLEAVNAMPEADGQHIFSDATWLSGKPEHITKVLTQGTVTDDIDVEFEPYQTRYVRYYVDPNNTKKNAMALEIEIMGFVTDKKPVVNAAQNKKAATFNGSWETHTNAFDGRTDTQWHANFPWASVYVDLGEEYEISQLKVAFPSDYFAKGGETKYRLEAVSGMPETDANGIYNDEDWAMGSTHTVKVLTTGTTTGDIDVKFEPCKTRYVRYYVDSSPKNEDGTDKNAMALEIEVMGFATGAEPETPLFNISKDKKSATFDSDWDAAKFALDGKLDTQWHAKQGWACFYIDLGDEYEISKLNVAFPSDYFAGGGSTAYRLEAVSKMPETDANGNFKDQTWLNDKEHIVKVLASGSVTGDIDVKFDPVTTRYVRYYVDGSPTGKNAMAMEIAVMGKLSSDNTLKDLQVNGETLADFSAETTDYMFSVPDDMTEAVVTATANDPKAKVTVENVTGNPADQTATVTVTAEDGSERVYTIAFKQDVLISKGKNVIGYVISYKDAANAVDGNLETSWQAYDGWGALFIDLGDVYDLSRIEINFANFADGNWKFKVEELKGMPPNDGKNTIDNPEFLGSVWATRTIFDNSGGSIPGDDIAVALNGKARYIKLHVDGNSGYKGGEKCEIKEVKVYVKEPAHEARLSELNLNGKSVEGFNALNTSYVYKVKAGESVPQISAKATTKSADVSIKQAEKVGDQAVVTVVSADGSRTMRYYVTFIPDDDNALVSYGKRTVVYNDKDAVPGYAVDGDLSTMWQSSGKDGVMIVDLGALYRTSLFHLVFDDANTGKWNFTIDKLSGMPALNGKDTDQNGDDLFVETLYTNEKDGNNIAVFLEKEVRYIRVKINGTDANPNPAVKEFSVMGKATGTSDVALNSLKVDGKDIPGFMQDAGRYVVDIPYGVDEVPQVSAETVDKNAVVSIKQADDVNGKAVVTVTSSDNTQTAEFVVQFVALGEEESIISDGKKVTASLEESGHEAEKAVDGNFDTFWKPKKSNQLYSLTFDLEKAYELTRIYHQFASGKSSDEYSIIVDGSMDGQNFYRLYNSNSDKEAGPKINMSFGGVARYVKVTYLGVNGYVNQPVELSEISVYGNPFTSLIESVTVDGEELPLFNEGQFDYNFAYAPKGDAIPQVVVTPVDGAKVKITQADAQDGLVTFTAEGFGITRAYTIQLIPVGSVISTPGEGPDVPKTGVDGIQSWIVVIMLSAALLTMETARRRKAENQK